MGAAIVRLLALVSVLAYTNIAASESRQSNLVAPLRQAYAHNDYLHDRPLLDALDQGFSAVEADIFLVGDQLLVAHRRSELIAERTLQSLYLEPLLARVTQNNGQVYHEGQQFILLVDIKSNGKKTYLALEQLLKSYASMLTIVAQGQVRQGAVTVIVSGKRAKKLIEQRAICYAGYDGRLSDVDSDKPASLMPMVSDNWHKYFDWNGIGKMPDDEKSRLMAMVGQAHDKNRLIRFWATPEEPLLWQELKNAGVDLINTDQLKRLSKFLRVDN